MRTIKFRAWNDINRTMIDLKSITPLALNMDTDGLFIPFSGMPIMQYTGLKDKNGKEIYEGDILQSKSNYQVKVTFNDGCFWAVGVKKVEGVVALYADSPDECLEIIGNIYENHDEKDHASWCRGGSTYEYEGTVRCTQCNGVLSR